MKALSFIKIFVLLAIISLPLSSFALVSIPFGGRITSVRTPPIVQCGSNAMSPFMITPSYGVPGPWSAIPGPINVGQIVPGAWILGLQTTIPGTCFTTTMPPMYYYTNTTNFYGTSVGSFGGF